MRRDRKGQTHIHPAGIALDGGVNELLDPGEVHDLVELAGHLLAGHPQDGAVEIDVLAPGQFGMEPGPDFEQAGDASLDPDPAAGGRGDAREYLEQGAFPCAVAPDDAQYFSLLDGERDILQRPDLFSIAVVMIGFANLKQWIGLATRPGPPHIQVVRKSPRAKLAQAIDFREILDRNNVHDVKPTEDGTLSNTIVPVSTEAKSPMFIRCVTIEPMATEAPLPMRTPAPRRTPGPTWTPSAT